MKSVRTRKTRTLAALPLVSSLALAACGSLSGPDTVDRETFVTTYVELRTAALTSGSEISDSTRSAILGANGVTEEELVEFVELRGEDLAFMREVWDEVETRLGTPIEGENRPAPGRSGP